MLEWKRLSKEWEQIDEIMVFGLGEVAEVFLDRVMADVKVKYIIDNKKAGKTYKGIPILSFRDIQEMQLSMKIVIMAETAAYASIEQELIGAGLKENIHYTGIERFIEEWFWIRYRKVCLMEIHTAVTTYCTFQCKNCNMFIPYYEKKEHYTSKDLIENVKVLFKNVDYVYKYQILGGEPFLNKELKLFLKYICAHYNNKIGRIRIITNGNVIPDEELTHIIADNNIEVHISDYTNVIPYQRKIEELSKLFKKSNIDFKVVSALNWKDFGYPDIERKGTKWDDVKKHMLNCATSWHGLAETKLFYCNVAWSAMNSGLFENMGCQDYVDLKSLDKSDLSKEKILSICLGELESYSHNFCSVCGGCGKDNTNIVKAGVQIV